MSDYDHPQNWEDLELGHHIVYYTFWPVLLIGFGIPVVTIPLYWFGYIPLEWALIIPWVGIWIICIYFGYLGDYVIPSETYRKYRSGEWDNEEFRNDRQ